MLRKNSVSGEAAWLNGKLRYINEAFNTDFSTPTEAAGFIATYEDDDALQSDMEFDAFIELHEKGDACVIIDRFVVLDRITYEKRFSRETTPEISCQPLYGSPFAFA
jgi:hypothetical protein